MISTKHLQEKIVAIITKLSLTRPGKNNNSRNPSTQHPRFPGDFFNRILGAFYAPMKNFPSMKFMELEDNPRNYRIHLGIFQVFQVGK